MAAAPRLLLVRHGETNENGQLDTQLNELGRLQAARTGQALQHEPIARVVSSPLLRAVHTAEAIAKYHPHVQIETDARIMERNFGVLQGKVYRGPAQKPDDTEGIESREAYAAY